jgi:hypothetical protein
MDAIVDTINNLVRDRRALASQVDNLRGVLEETKRVLFRKGEMILKLQERVEQLEKPNREA